MTPPARPTMRVRSAATLYLVVAILFIIAVATEVFIVDLMHPMSTFSYFVLTTLLSGVLASIVVERIDAKLLD
jgi:hypothetical protein